LPDRLADDDLDRTSPPGPEPADDPEFRARLEAAVGADYRIERLIGEGGFGRVYGATDVRLDRPVAIKVIRPDLAGARAFLDRFRREAMAMAKFRHAGIVPIYDINERDGLIYFVMPLIAGDTLRARLQKHRVIAPQETRKLLVELCECLAASHRAGIVHRDIKPDNVILEGGAISRALLMDFGIAKSMAEFDGTGSGAMIGTPTYMSPEQANGDALIDHRSDIYSVGVLAYHMLTGRPPFTGASPRAIIAAHMMKEPDAIRKLNPSVPKPFADAVARCLAKEPGDRFQDAMELSAELQRVAFGPEVLPYAETRQNFAWPFFLGVATTAIAAAAIAATFGGLDSGTIRWMAVGLAVVALSCSPVVRALTDPWSERLKALFRRRAG
jgi:serine/threonine protein kinase